MALEGRAAHRRRRARSTSTSTATSTTASAAWSVRSTCTNREAGSCLPHEDVIEGIVADRLAMMTASEANLEPILLVYDGAGATAA